MKMLPEIRARWATALPQYAQTSGALRRHDKFCCLGVLCEIVRPDLWNGDEHDTHGGLPSPAITKLIRSDEFELTAFAGMNDRFGWSFETISAVVARDPERAELHALAQIAMNIGFAQRSEPSMIERDKE